MIKKFPKISGHMVILLFMFLILLKVILLVIIIVKADIKIPVTNNEDTGQPSEEVVRDDYFTSLIGVQKLVKREQEIVWNLKRYRQKLQDRIELMDYYLNDYADDIRSVIESSNNFERKLKREKFPTFETPQDIEWLAIQVSSNPLAVFKLLRRFKQEFSDIATDIHRVNLDTDIKHYFGMLDKLFKVPTLTDLDGAADGLLRLQEAYQLSTFELAKGTLIEKKTLTTFLASDLQFMGMRALNLELYARSVQWLYLAYQRVIRGDDSIPKDIVEYHLRAAADMHNKELLAFRPTQIRDLFTNVVNSNFSNVPNLYIPVQLWEYPIGATANAVSDVFNFHALCRGEQFLPPKAMKNLRCWYSAEHSPFNILSPFKFELLHENPPVYQVYDMLNENDIKLIRGKAFPYMRRSKIIGNDRKGSYADTRTSSVAWLTNGLIQKVPRIIKGSTGLECENFSAAEDLQVSCYGSVGGYYVPHYDAFSGVKPKSQGTSFEESDDGIKRGDRIATVMFYLSDVELGGGTAFPRLGVAAKPVKGSAVIWYNLKKNGLRDELMLHGGCPVLHGNKWVANKWIRVNEQLHTRKCSTSKDE